MYIIHNKVNKFEWRIKLFINPDDLREKLNTKITVILNDKSVNKEFEEKMRLFLSKKGISPAETSLLLDKKIPLETMDVIFLGVFCEAVGAVVDEIPSLKYLSKQFVIEEMFTESEINGINGFVKNVNASVDFVEFGDVIELADDIWLGRISNKEIKRLFDNNLLGYDSEQQRELIYKKHKSTFIGKIDMDTNQRDEVVDLMINKKYHPTMLMFNMSYGANYQYDSNEKTLKIPGIIYVVGGWTRCNANLLATIKDPSLLFYNPVQILCKTASDAADVAWQENKQRKFRVGMNKNKNEEPSTLLVKEIEKRSDFFNGRIGANKIDSKMFLFGIYSSIMDEIYGVNLRDNVFRLNTAKYIIAGFDDLVYKDMLDFNTTYDDESLIYYNLCIKIANEQNIDLIELINKNPINEVVENIKSRGLKPKIRRMKEMIKYE